MTTLANASNHLSARRRRHITMGAAVWAPVLLSRLLVMAAASAGALFAQYRYDAMTFDPYGFSRHLGTVGNVLAASTDRWDAIHYLQIAQHGYTTAASTAFFPLYPLLIDVVAWITQSEVVAGVLVSAAAFAVALELLHRLARQEMDGGVANAAVLLLAFAPLSLFFTAIYTESLFLALSVATFYLCRHDRLWLASLPASAAALTHIQGALLVVPLAFCWWERQGKPRSVPRLVCWQAAPLLAPLCSLAALFLFLHARGFGWIAPISNQSDADWRHQFVGPAIGVIRAVSAGISGLWQTTHGTPALLADGSDAFSIPFQSVIYLFVLAICLAALAQTWKRLPKVYALYSGLYLVLVTSSPTKGNPLASFDRFALLLFPLWIVAADWLRERSLLRPAILIGAVSLLFYSFEFGRWIFIA